MKEIISHEAVVKAVGNEHVCVTIVQSSACSGCAARQMCNSAEAKQKDVDVYTPDASSFRVGQRVVLDGQLSDGRFAAVIAYGLPLLLLIAVLFVAIWLTGSEAIGALCSLLAVVVYYGGVYLFMRQRLQRRFSFHIRETAANS